MLSETTKDLIAQLESLGAFVDLDNDNHPGMDELDCKYGLVDEELLMRVLRERDFQSLFSLDLVDCPITDQACESIANCSNLRYLHLCGTQVTDDGVQRLSRLKKLVSLRLRGTKIEGNQELGLSRLRNLEEIVLAETAIGDSVVRQVAALKKLSHVYLQNTHVSADVIDILLGMPSLKFLSLIGNVSCASRIAEFRMGRPDVHLDY